jgi:gamma-glutamyltranspeptidase/glutathione hydrolase
MAWTGLLEPAIRCAEEGIQVLPRTAAGWQRSAGRLPRDSVYLVDGRPPREGSVLRVPEMATTLRRIADEGPAAIYAGDMAARIAGHVERLGGPMRAEDLAAHRVTWEEPIRGSFRGVDVWELGPSTQGAVALIALGLLDRSPPDVDRTVAADRLIRALRVAFDEAARSIGDPSDPDAQSLDVPEAVDRLAERIDRPFDEEAVRFPPGTDTVFTAIADGHGAVCALSTSLYDGFGSGVEVPGTGIVLHNRAAGFSLEGGVNVVRPGARPYHTLVPAMAVDGSVRAAVGFVGAFMQPQAQVQALIRILDQGLDPQAALDSPRLRLESDGQVALEPGLADLEPALRDLGHRVLPLEVHRAGIGQFVAVDGGRLVGASDPRHDGVAQAVANG